MELGQYQLQIFTSLVVILVAAVGALICDFLKGNNEQLRELNIELRVRREEDQRRVQALTARSMQAGAPAAAAQPVESQPMKERAEKRAEMPASPRSMATPPERKRAVAPEALAAMERGAQLAGAGRMGTPAPARRMDPAPVLLKPIPVASRPSVNVGKKDWNSLLSRGVQSAASDVAKPAETVQVPAVLPAGFQEGFVLKQLVQNHQPVTGLVVSIGVNSNRPSDGTLPANVVELVHSLIGPEDFACQSSPEEFLLIYPTERGASAQRKLSEIAERLWDFQLGSMGTYSILFSWGGVEVNSETIDEAISSANERMQDTRRGRKLLMMETRKADTQLRKAV